MSQLLLNFTDTITTKLDGKIYLLVDGRFVEFDAGKWLQDNLNALNDTESKAGILINVLASASGMLINNRVYPGTEWKKAAKDFADKPILKHHDDRRDAIGRIKEGVFTQLLDGDAFLNDRYSPAIQNSGKPSGLVYVKARITDPDAIKKINDERLLHTSQGSRASGATCSICRKNIRDGFCGHMPGTMYHEKNDEKKPKKLAYWHIEGLQPKELSFVNEPALGMSRVLSSEIADNLVGEQLLGVMDHVNALTPIVLGSNVRGLTFVDAAGNSLEAQVLKEQKYEIWSISNHPEKELSDNSAADSSATGYPVNDKEEAMSQEHETQLKALQDQVTKLTDEKGEMVTSNKALREESARVAADLAESKKLLDEIQKRYDVLLAERQSDLADEYINAAGVDAKDAEATKKHLITLDAESLRFMIKEAARLSKKTIVVHGDIAAATDGNKGEAGSTDELPRKKRKSSLLK